MEAGLEMPKMRGDQVQKMLEDLKIWHKENNERKARDWAEMLGIDIYEWKE